METGILDMMKPTKFLFAAAMTALSGVYASADVSWDTYSDTWVAVDELGRKVAVAGDGVERQQVDPEVSIGMFYYIWHGFHTEWDKTVTELLDESTDNPQWGPVGTFHWGSTPWLGRYKGGNQYIVARHMQMLMDAGVDFLFFDATNAYVYPVHVRTVMAEIDRREALGLKSPKLAFMLHSKAPATLTDIYNRFYSADHYSKYWYYYDGKPLVLADKNEMGTLDKKIVDHFTFRNSWAWMNGANPDEWSWLEYYPQQPGYTMVDGNKRIEQISVSVAQHAHSKVGRSYHNGKEPAFYAKGVCEETPYGLYFQEQWDQAMKVHAPIVMVTQFNEWIAQRFEISNETEMGYVRPGAYASIGETYFIDVYNAEFSRDIEPDTHRLIRDNYYMQLVSNVRKYRGARPIPEPTVNLSIDIAGAFDQWSAESVEYRDDRKDTQYTSSTVQTPSTLRRATNDIVLSKVTQDDSNLYFYVETQQAISDFDTSDLWMRLMLNTDTDYSTGWWGYDYCVYKDSATGKYSLMKHSGDGFGWTTVCPVDYRVEGNRMHLRLPRAAMGITGKCDVDFKWTDNISDDNPDIMTFISDGDVAPNGRFNYRYKGSVQSSGVADVTTDDADDRFNVTVDGREVVFTHSFDSPVDLGLYDMMGRCVHTVSNVSESRVGITVPSGVFVVRYSSGGVAGVRKFIVR